MGHVQPQVDFGKVYPGALNGCAPPSGRVSVLPGPSPGRVWAAALPSLGVSCSCPCSTHHRLSPEHGLGKNSWALCPEPRGLVLP